jgi:hypothetical protein
MTNDCQQCGHPLEILKRPLRRLRWTRYWWRGLASFVAQPLRVCTKCGSIYTAAGALVAAGAAETDAELRLRGFKEDMAHLRDGFATIVLVGEVGAVWTLMSAVSYDPRLTVLMGAIGGLSLVPFTFFARKASKAKRELKGMKTARLRGLTSE